jgi:hypothetical protein
LSEPAQQQGRRPKYLLEAPHTSEGTRGLAKEGASSWRKMVTEMMMTY